MAARATANPHVGISRRNCQRADARQHPLVAQQAPVVIEIDKVLAASLSRIAGLGIGNVDEPGTFVRHRASGKFFLGANSATITRRAGAWSTRGTAIACTCRGSRERSQP